MKHSKLVRAALVAAILSPLPLHADDDPPAAGITTIRRTFTGTVSYQGFDIKYIVGAVRHDSTNKAGAEGSVIFFVPPVDFARDPMGIPIIHVADPDGGGPFVISKASVAPATSADIAKAVWEGRIEKDAPVIVAFEIRMVDDPTLKKAILDGARVQISKHVQTQDSAVTYREFSGDYELAEKSVSLLPVKTLEVVCLTPGLESVRFSLDRTPTLGRSMRFTGQVPARFLGFLHGPAGASFACRFIYEASDDAQTSLLARKLVDGLIDSLLKSKGDGATSIGRDRELSILVTRDQLERVTRDVKWRESFVLRVGTERDANLLLRLFQNSDADLFAVNAADMETWLDRQFGMRDLINQPGFAKELADVSAKEQLSDADYEHFRSILKARSSSVSGEASVSVGIFGGGGGFGVSNASADGEKSNDRKSFHDFLRDLNTYHIDGKFPIKPKVDYALVGHARTSEKLERRLDIIRPGTVATREITAPFHAAATSPVDSRPRARVEGELRRKAMELSTREEVARRALSGAKELSSDTVEPKSPK